jgi:hypothetical protein
MTDKKKRNKEKEKPTYVVDLDDPGEGWAATVVGEGSSDGRGYSLASALADAPDVTSGTPVIPASSVPATPKSSVASSAPITPVAAPEPASSGSVPSARPDTGYGRSAPSGGSSTNSPASSVPVVAAAVPASSVPTQVTPAEPNGPNDPGDNGQDNNDNTTQNTTIEKLIGLLLPVTTAAVIADAVDPGYMPICDVIGEYIGMPGAFSVAAKGVAMTAGLVGGAAVYVGLDGLLNAEFPDFANRKSRVSEYFLKFGAPDLVASKIIERSGRASAYALKFGVPGLVASKVIEMSGRASAYALKFGVPSKIIERSGRASAYALKFGVAGFAVSQLIPGLTEMFGALYFGGEAALTGMAATVGGLTGLVKPQYIPGEDADSFGKRGDRFMKRQWEPATKVIGKGLAVGVGGLCLYLAARQGVDYVAPFIFPEKLPSPGLVINVGKTIMDAVYLVGLGGFSYVATETLWNLGEDQTIVKDEEDEDEKSEWEYDPDTHTYSEVGKEQTVPFAQFVTGRQKGTSFLDDGVLFKMLEKNRPTGVRTTKLKFELATGRLNVVEHDKVYDGRVREERDFEVKDGQASYHPPLGQPPDSEIDRGYGAISIDELVSHPEKTMTGSPEYNTFVRELVKELFFQKTAVARREGSLDSLIARKGITQPFYDINKDEKSKKNKQGRYTTFNEKSRVCVGADIDGVNQEAEIEVYVEGKAVAKKGDKEGSSQYKVVIDVKSAYAPRMIRDAVGTALGKVYERTKEEFGEVEIRANGNYFSVKEDEAPELKRKDIVRSRTWLRKWSIPAMALCALVSLGNLVYHDIETIALAENCSTREQINDGKSVCYVIGEANRDVNNGNYDAVLGTTNEDDALNEVGTIDEFVSQNPQRRYKPVAWTIAARAGVAKEAAAAELEGRNPDYADELRLVNEAKRMALPGNGIGSLVGTREQIKHYEDRLIDAQNDPSSFYVLQEGDRDQTGSFNPITLSINIAEKLAGKEEYAAVGKKDLAKMIYVANEGFKEYSESPFFAKGVGYPVNLPAQRLLTD